MHNDIGLDFFVHKSYTITKVALNKLNEIQVKNLLKRKLDPLYISSTSKKLHK